MRRSWERRSARILATALSFAVIVAMSSGIAELAGSDELDAATAAVFLVPIAVFGLVLAKWWVLVLPTLWSALLLAVLRIADLITGACSVCGSDEDWGNYPLFFFAIAVVPVTAVLLIGVVIGILARPLWRSRPNPLDSG